MTEAIQRDRNKGSRSGAQAETGRLAAIGSITGIRIISAMKNSLGSPRPANSERRTASYQRLPTSDYRPTPKRPLTPPPCPHTINGNPHNKNHRRVPYLLQ